MSTARSYALALLLMSAAVVGGALLFQHAGGVAPCPMCLWQRWPWYLTIALALVTVLAGGRAGTPFVLALCGLILAGGAVLAAYHVGVEQRWLAPPSTCTGAAAGADSVEALKAQIMGTAPVRCDEVAWSLFGISLAGWNALASIAVAAFAFWGFRRLRAEAAAA